MPKDRDLRAKYKFRACVVCGRRGCDPSHIKTYGATGIDAEWNIVPMCRPHHVEWGLGALTFLAKYPKVKHVLIGMGWEFLEDGRKLWHPAFDPERGEAWRHMT